MVVNSTIAETTVHRLLAIDVLLSHSMIDRFVSEYRPVRTRSDEANGYAIDTDGTPRRRA
jgi:hypothetical protein